MGRWLSLHSITKTEKKKEKNDKKKKGIWKKEKVIGKNKFDYIDWLGGNSEMLTILEIEYFISCT